MPITRELENIEELEAVNFNHEQAKTIAKIIEQAQTDSHESLKEFIRNEINGLELRIDSKLSNLKADLLIKIFAIIFGTSGMLFAMLKLFG